MAQAKTSAQYDQRCSNCAQGYGVLAGYNQSGIGTVAAPVLGGTVANAIIPAWGGIGYSLPGFNQSINGSGYYRLTNAYPAFNNICSGGYNSYCNP